MKCVSECPAKALGYEALDDIDIPNRDSEA